MTMKGFLRTVAYDTKQKKVIADLKYTNLVVTGGVNEMAKLLANTSGTVVTHGAIGTSATAAAASQTGLSSETGSRVAVAATTAATGTASFTFSYGTAPSGTIQEVGLFNSSSAGTMFARATHGSIVKTSDVTLAYTYNVVFSGT
jgi:hypothetical protein